MLDFLFTQQIDYSVPISILSTYTLLSAVTVGVVTSAVVLINARRMKGGVFGSAMNYFGVGMIIVLVGFSTTFLHFSLLNNFIQMINDVLYITGYIAMAIAASKIFNATKGE